MIKKSDIEMERHRILKVSRALIRLKHSLAADLEINEVLPDKLAEFDIALQQGQLLSLPEGWAEEVFDETSS
jgi:hypothetical protein